MSRPPHLAELSRNVRFGLLGEEVAYSTSRALVGEKLSGEEQATLNLAASVLRSLPPGNKRTKAAGGKYMASDESYLDAIEVVRTVEPTESVREFLEQIAAALERASTTGADDAEWLKKANVLFTNFGRFAESRSSEFTTSAFSARRPWTSLRATSSF